MLIAVLLLSTPLCCRVQLLRRMLLKGQADRQQEQRQLLQVP